MARPSLANFPAAILSEAIAGGKSQREFPQCLRFKPPWNVERIPGGYLVKDATGQALAYVYARENETAAGTAKVLTMDEPRRIAVNRQAASFAFPKRIGEPFGQL